MREKKGRTTVGKATAELSSSSSGLGIGGFDLVDAEDFVRKNGKLLQMLEALDRLFGEDENPDDIELIAEGKEQKAEQDIREQYDLANRVDRRKDKKLTMKDREERSMRIEKATAEAYYSALASRGRHTRRLTEGVMKSRYYAWSDQMVEWAFARGYIKRINVRRPTEYRRGNPNLRLNFITSKGRELLVQLGRSPSARAKV
jgi:hypothetical protein